MTKSKGTIGAIIAAVGGSIVSLGPQIDAMTDGNPETLVAWPTVSGAIVVLLSAIFLGKSAMDKSKAGSMRGISPDHRRPTPTPAPPPKALSLAMFVLLVGVMLLGQVGCQHVGQRFDQDAKQINSETNAANRASWSDEAGNIHAEGGVGASTVTKITDGEIVQSKGGTSNRTVVMSKKPDGNVQLALSSDTDIAAESLSFDNATGKFEVRGFSTTVSEPQRAINEGLVNVQATWQKVSGDQKEAFIRQMQMFETAGGQLGQFAGELLKTFVRP